MKLKDILTVYKRSVDWGLLANSSKIAYNVSFDKLQPIIMKDVADIKRRDILKIRDSLSDRPATANSFITVASRILSFAVDREYIDVNVAANVKRMKMGEYRPWTNAELAAFEEHATGYVRTAFLLALYTGQRYKDVFGMRWTDYNGDTIKVRQLKTGRELVLFCHPRLKAELDSLPRNGEFIMTSDGIHRYVRSTFNRHWYSTLKAAGLRNTGCVFHGLRKTAASKLAEAGASVHEIMAVTGHRTIAMVQKYTDAAEQERRSKSAMQKLAAMEASDVTNSATTSS